MKNIIQITLTEEERVLMNKLIHVGVSFLVNVYGDVGWNSNDLIVVSSLENSPDAIEALVTKLTLDKV